MSVWIKPRPHSAHKTSTEVSSSIPHFLQIGLLRRPITYKCRLRVLCPVRKPITTLDCVLLNDNNRAPVAKLSPEINSPACLVCCRSTPHYQMLAVHPAFYLSSNVLPWDPPRKTLIPLTSVQNRPLRSCQRFHFLPHIRTGAKVRLWKAGLLARSQCAFGRSYDRQTRSRGFVVYLDPAARFSVHTHIPLYM